MSIDLMNHEQGPNTKDSVWGEYINFLDSVSYFVSNGD